MAGRAGANPNANPGASGPARYLGAGDRVPGPADLNPGTRWTPPPATAKDRPGAGAGAERRSRVEDGIVILESEFRSSMSGSGSSGAGSRGARPQSTRRGGRGRSSAAGPTGRSAEPAKPRALSGLVNHPLGEGKGGRLEIAPLASPLVPIDLPLAQTVSSSVTGATASKHAMAAVTGAEVRSRLATASQLREIALLSEILQPPVSLRAPRRPFRSGR